MVNNYKLLKIMTTFLVVVPQIDKLSSIFRKRPGTERRREIQTRLHVDLQQQFIAFFYQTILIIIIDF